MYDLSDFSRVVASENRRDPGKLVWQIASGERRGRRSTARSGVVIVEGYDPDELEEEVTAALMEEDEGSEAWAWVEIRTQGKTRILKYWPFDLRDAAVALTGGNMDAAAVMAVQLVASNKQILGAFSGLLKENRHLLGELGNKGILMMEMVVERRMEDMFSKQQLMATALEKLTPTFQRALEVWAQKRTERAADKREEETPDRDPEKVADAVVADFAWLCERAPESITMIRMAAILGSLPPDVLDMAKAALEAQG